MKQLHLLLAFLSICLSPLSAQTGTLQALYLPYLDGSGTTLHDQSGNSYNCTLGSGNAAPAWSGPALVFTPNPTTGTQYVTCPYQALDGAKGIQIFYAPTIPSTFDTSNLWPSTILS